MATTRITRRIMAPRSRVYRALIDPRDVQAWMVPDGIDKLAALVEGEGV